jgi:14-3-3 protein epsilon
MSRLDRLDSLSSDELLILARFAENAERYDDMVPMISTFVKQETRDLNVEERNLLSVAYKNVVGSRRQSWRVVKSIEHKEESRNRTENKVKAETYKGEIEGEILRYCNEIIQLVDSHLLGRAAAHESKVFYHKMKGDYFRYICEFARGATLEDASQNALQSYQAAADIADAELQATHPTRLGLALNYSVFYYEIIKETTKACEMARKAFDEGLPNVDELEGDSYKDSTLILQLLRDNISLWTAEAED